MGELVAALAFIRPPESVRLEIDWFSEAVPGLLLMCEPWWDDEEGTSADEIAAILREARETLEQDL